MIDALVLLSNRILIEHIFEFWFSPIVPGLIWEFVEFLPHGIWDTIIPKVIGDKFVIINNCSLFEIELFLD